MSAPSRAVLGKWSLFLLAIACLGAVLMAVLSRDVPAQRPFDRAAWLEVNFQDRVAVGRVRGAMVDDLIDHVLHVGDTRERVVGLLGPPASESHSREFPYPSWTLGQAHTGMSHTDDVHLFVEFDTNGRVAGVRAPTFGKELP